jgi:hypothetical protein
VKVAMQGPKATLPTANGKAFNRLHNSLDLILLHDHGR